MIPNNPLDKEAHDYCERNGVLDPRDFYPLPEATEAYKAGHASGKIAGRQEVIDEMAGVEINLRSINSSVTDINDKYAGRIKALEDESHNALKCVTEQATRIKALEGELLKLFKEHIDATDAYDSGVYLDACCTFPLAAELAKEKL